MVEHYPGLCIGGPVAGRWIDNPNQRYKVAQRGPFTFNTRDIPDYQTFEYAYRPIIGTFKAWAPKDWTHDEIVEELMKNYRPLAPE